MKDKLFSVRDGLLEDCLTVAENISPADGLEIQAALGCSAAQALKECYLRSFSVWCVCAGKRAVFVFGLSREDWRWIMPWAFSTPEVRNLGVYFIRGSKRTAAALFKRYPFMRNRVDARHTSSIAWLRFMGFELGSPEPYGFEGRPFIPFYHLGR